MTTRLQILRHMRLTITALGIVLSFIGCSEEKVMPARSGDERAAAEEITPDGTEQVSSISISGVHTLVVPEVDCSTCTYVVPANSRTVDGATLGLRPGSVICLKTGMKYASVEFENIIGSEDKPIIIGYCAE